MATYTGAASAAISYLSRWLQRIRRWTGPRRAAAWHRRRRYLLGALMVLPLTSACATNHERVFRWEEEFVLDSGERLLLERTVRFRRSGEPGNPMIIGWAREDSTISVKEGPADLIGATYALKDWIDPVVLERDPSSRALVMVGTAWNCDWVKRFGAKSRSLYVAFRLRPGAEAEAIDFPEWTWGKERKLYKMYFYIEPPAHVTPAEAERHNKKGARGAPEFFRIDRTIKFCGA